VTPTLSGYIARRFAVTLAGAAAVVFALIVIGNMIELLRRNDDGEARFGELLALGLLMTPRIALTVLPFTVMLATIACYARLARSAELIVTRAAGVSAWAAIAPAALSAGLLGAVGFAVLNPVAAAMSLQAESLESRLWGGGDRFSLSAEGLWLRQADGDGGQTVIHAGAADPSATRLRDVTLFIYEREDLLTERVDAESATLAEGEWRLSDGLRRAVDPDDETVAPPERFETFTLETPLSGDQILESFAPPETVSFWALPGFIRTLEEAGFSAERHRLYWHAQLAQPLLFGAMVLIGAAFSMRHARLGGLGAMALWAAMTGFAFFFLTDVSKALGASGAVPAALAAWAPPAAAALFAAGLLLHLEDG